MLREFFLRSHASRLILMAFFGTLVASTALAEPPKPASANPTEQNLTLRFTTPDGRIYLKLVPDSNGPVELPVKDATVSALQVSTQFEANGVLRVGIHGVGTDQVTYPVSSYQFDLHDAGSAFERGDGIFAVGEPPIELGELASFGLNGWTLELAAPPPPIADADACGCCSCGWLTCCPNAGHCLTCSPCGSCCCAGPGDPPKPAQQW